MKTLGLAFLFTLASEIELIVVVVVLIMTFPSCGNFI
jgi:hypothetical protein